MTLGCVNCVFLYRLLSFGEAPRELNWRLCSLTNLCQGLTAVTLYPTAVPGACIYEQNHHTERVNLFCSNRNVR